MLVLDKIKETIDIVKFDYTMTFYWYRWQIARLYYFRKCCDFNNLCY